MSVVVMGVSGCGQSTIGALLAAELGAVFVDGDSLHPLENIQKMAAEHRSTTPTEGRGSSRSRSGSSTGMSSSPVQH